MEEETVLSAKEDTTLSEATADETDSVEEEELSTEETTTRAAQAASNTSSSRENRNRFLSRKIRKKDSFPIYNSFARHYKTIIDREGVRVNKREIYRNMPFLIRTIIVTLVSSAASTTGNHALGRGRGVFIP